jgi:hypothetical protein
MEISRQYQTGTLAYQSLCILTSNGDIFACKIRPKHVLRQTHQVRHVFWSALACFGCTGYWKCLILVNMNKSAHVLNCPYLCIFCAYLESNMDKYEPRKMACIHSYLKIYKISIWVNIDQYVKIALLPFHLPVERSN